MQLPGDEANSAIPIFFDFQRFVNRGIFESSAVPSEEPQLAVGPETSVSNPAPEEVVLPRHQEPVYKDRSRSAVGQLLPELVALGWIPNGGLNLLAKFGAYLFVRVQRKNIVSRR